MNKNELKDLYYQMLLIRRSEEKAAEMYTLGKIGGFLHLYIGQEAVAVGAISTLRKDDYVISAYREHGHCIIKGSDPKKVMAELFGKDSGVSKGKGGSMHMFDVGNRFMGGHAIVGGHLPLAVGMGYAIKYRGKDQVVLCFFGEGAVNEGAFHESLNIASLWKLPVIFLCENNRYGMGTPIERASALYHVYERACAYDMERYQLDGMDVLKVLEVVGQAVKRARKDKTPTLIEAITYRFRGHSMADPAHYRTKEELEEHKKRDPLLLFKQRLSEEGIMDENEFKEVDEKARKIVQEAADYADRTPPPSTESLMDEVYA